MVVGTSEHAAKDQVKETGQSNTGTECTSDRLQRTEVVPVAGSANQQDKKRKSQGPAIESQMDNETAMATQQLLSTEQMQYELVPTVICIDGNLALASAEQATEMSDQQLINDTRELATEIHVTAAEEEIDSETIPATEQTQKKAKQFQFKGLVDAVYTLPGRTLFNLQGYQILRKMTFRLASIFFSFFFFGLVLSQKDYFLPK